MNLKCRCGGSYKSIDQNYDSGIKNAGHVCWATKRMTPGYATWKCNSCGLIRTQKLRVSTKLRLRS